MESPTSFSDAIRVRAPEHVLMQEVGGDAAILNLHSERYFGLDSIGARMWQIAVEAPSLRDAQKQLCAEYEVEPAQLRADLHVLLLQLREHDLLVVENPDEPSAA